MTPAFLPLLHPLARNGRQIATSTISAHLAFEDTPAANMLLPRCAPLAHLCFMELRNLEWAALSPDASAPLMSVFQSLTALGVHRATFPHAHTLRRLVASFPALERLALSDISVVPCMCNAYQPSEGAKMAVPKGLRSLTLDMGVASSSSKPSQAEELLGWLANGDGCAKLATLDVRGLTRASFPALASFLAALPTLEHLRLAFLEDIGADDLEATPIHLQASLRTLHITAPSLASSIHLLPILPLLSRSGMGPTQPAALTLTLPSLGPAHLRRLPWAKLTPLLPQSPPSSSPSSPALKVRVYGWPESILPEITPILSQPHCLGASLPKGSWSAEAFSRTYALESDSDPHGYPHTQRSRKRGRAASISLALRRLPAAAPGAADSSTIAGYTAGALALFAGGASVGGVGAMGINVGAETVGEVLGAVGGAVGKAFPWLLLAPVVLTGGVMYAGGLGGHDEGDGGDEE